MGLPSVFQTGRSAMQASKAAIATTGHNIANANTEGYTRQRIETAASTPKTTPGSKAMIGDGVHIQRHTRINDEYLEKQLRNGNREMAHYEEKELALKQTEDIFNEMNGEGLNRIMTRFFNEFRKLANEPDNDAIRESVRESSQALVNDFRRLRREVDEVRGHLDARVEGHSAEVNSIAQQIATLNKKIRECEITGVQANDMQDQRDLALKKLAGFLTIHTHKDNFGNVNVDVPGVGPLITGDRTDTLTSLRTPKDAYGKPDNSFDVKTTGSAQSVVTHQIKGGRIGALIETRDQTLSTILERLDDLAYGVAEAVNSVHSEGFSRYGVKGVAFFAPLAGKERAAEYLQLSDPIKASINNIAAASIPDAPSDNRIALAIAGIQSNRFMNDGKSNLDEFYNSIITDVGVTANRNKANINQQRDILNQLNKFREQVAGVSIDEETTNMMQYQHTFDASAKVIQVADEMLKTVLELKR